MDQFIILRLRAALELEQLPAAVEEVDSEPPMSRFLHRVHGHVIHDSVLSFDDGLQPAKGVLISTERKGKPALVEEQAFAVLL